MIKRINEWWMGLEPGEQYMYLIITFCMMLMSGIGILLGVVGIFVGHATLPIFLFLLAAGISCFVGFFMIVVIFLTVIWPYHYRKENKLKKTI